MNYLAIIVCGIAAVVIGSIWYGPFLFGKFWMEQGMNASNMTPEEQAKMKKMMGMMYFIQFIMSLITAAIIELVILHWAGTASPVLIAIILWFGFAMPIHVGGALWGGKKPGIAIKVFLVSAGSALVTFIATGIILGAMM